MYATCLFCHAPLGANAVVERFPVGRRLAFDVEKGRLWAVCAACGRWNLSPLEERWEAVEDCERLFRSAHERTSTRDVGLARCDEGTELVRVGAASLPELAGWRYGREMHRRHRRSMLAFRAGAVAFGALWVGAGAGAMLPIAALYATYYAHLARGRFGVVARVPVGSDRALTLRAEHLEGVALAPGGGTLRVPHEGGARLFHGGDAVRVAGLLLARVNSAGAPDAQVARAVADIERAGGAEPYVEASARQPAAPFGALGADQSLALEMAVQEMHERRALGGELARLAVAWREAEAIAAIADDLLLPAWIGERIRAMRSGERDGARATIRSTGGS
ncbi:MAG: hypothetical protein WKG32_11960 [Gemmatimonadaceae bacterium]